MAGKKIVVSVAADTRQFKRAMNGLKRESGLMALEKFGRKAGKVLAVGMGAASVAAGFLTKEIYMAGEQADTANTRIKQAATSMGLFGNKTGEVAERLAKLADKTALQTGIDANQIKLTQAKLMTFKDLAKTADQVGGAFDRATAAAVDMQAAGFGTAEQNAVQLGKALNDPIHGITALNRSGINFTETEKKRIATLVKSNQIGKAQALILGAIEKQVKGQAAATANASDQLKVFGTELEEHLGQKLTPIVAALTQKLVANLPAIEHLADAAINKLTPALDKTGKFIKTTLVPAFKTLLPVITDTVLPAITHLVSILFNKVIPAIVKTVTFIVKWRTVFVPLAAAIAAPIVALKGLDRAIKTVKAGQEAFTAGQKLLQTRVAHVKENLTTAKSAALALKGGITTAATGIKSGAMALAEMGKNGLKAAAAITKTAAAIALQKARIVASMAVMATQKAATMAATAAQWAMNAALTANPIGIVIAAIAAFVAALVYLYKNNTTVRKGIQKAWGVIKNAIGTAWNFIKGIFNYMSDAASSLMKWYVSLPDKIINALSNVGSWLYNSGKDLIYGFINGIGSMAGELWDAAKNIAYSAIDSIESALGINSPSRVFMRIGRSTGKGMVIGIDQMGKHVRAAAQRMANAATINPPTIPAPIIAGYNSPATHSIVVNVHALNANAETGRMVKTALDDYYRVNGR